MYLRSYLAQHIDSAKVEEFQPETCALGLEVGGSWLESGMKCRRATTRVLGEEGMGLPC